MAVLCGMPTIQCSARSAGLSVRLSKWASKDVLRLGNKGRMAHSIGV